MPGFRALERTPYYEVVHLDGGVAEGQGAGGQAGGEDASVVFEDENENVYLSFRVILHANGGFQGFFQNLGRFSGPVVLIRIPFLSLGRSERAAIEPGVDETAFHGKIRTLRDLAGAVNRGDDLG